MSNQNTPDDFAGRLLRQDERLDEAKYHEYRVRLENALRAAERRLKLTGWVVVVSCLVSLTLMFVGGSKVFGDFDPWSRNANGISIVLGIIFMVATVLFWISLVSYYSGLRSGLADAKDRVRDANILEFQRQIRELHDVVQRSLRRDEPPPGRP